MTIRTMIVSLISITCAAHGYGASALDDAAFFSKSVQPILADNCIKCHGPDRQKGHLRLDSREAVLAGGKSGPAVVVGKPEESVLIKAVRYTDDDLQMPPKKQLSDDDVKVLVDWVTRGAPWSADAAAAPPKPDSPKQP
jgi:mono/diheme cytochrome c family protein